MAEENFNDRMRGKIIVLDGPDGCGKTTQVKLLTEWLQNQGVPTSSYRDPGDTVIGERIRQILLSPEHIVMSTRAEMLLHMAARAQLWQEKMVPVLRDNKCIVLDRWVSSTCAYQGHAGAFGIRNVIKLAMDSLARAWPDLTIILDVDVKTGFKRLPGKLDRMEAKGRKYHKDVREGFLKLASQEENFVVIDARKDIETIHKNIVEEVSKFF